MERNYLSSIPNGVSGGTNHTWTDVRQNARVCVCVCACVCNLDKRKKSTSIAVKRYYRVDPCVCPRRRSFGVIFVLWERDSFGRKWWFWFFFEKQKFQRSSTLLTLSRQSTAVLNSPFCSHWLACTNRLFMSLVTRAPHSRSYSACTSSSLVGKYSLHDLSASTHIPFSCKTIQVVFCCYLFRPKNSHINVDWRY